MKLDDAGVLVRQTHNLLTSKVVLAAAIACCASVWPSVSRAIETGQWTPKDTTNALGALGALVGTAVLRYADEDDDNPTMHTPTWMPGRNVVKQYEDITQHVTTLMAAVAPRK